MKAIRAAIQFHHLPDPFYNRKHRGVKAFSSFLLPRTEGPGATAQSGGRSRRPAAGGLAAAPCPRVPGFVHFSASCSHRAPGFSKRLFSYRFTVSLVLTFIKVTLFINVGVFSHSEPPPPPPSSVLGAASAPRSPHQFFQLPPCCNLQRWRVVLCCVGTCGFGVLPAGVLLGKAG